MNEQVEIKILNYFESYVNDDTYIYLPDYIYNLINILNDDSVIKNMIININSIYNLYIIKIRNSLRIKINQLIFNDYINIINKILYKINYHKYLFSNYINKFNDILSDNYTQLFNNIIIDPIIFTKIYNKLFNLLDKENIIKICDVVKEIQKINNTPDNLYLHLINIIKKVNMSNIHLKLNDTIVPLPLYLNNLNKLNIILKDINIICNLFDFLDKTNQEQMDIKNLISCNIELLLNNIYVLVNNDIDINNYIIINLHEELKQLNIYYTNENVKLICNNILVFTSTFINQDYNTKLLILYNSNLFYSNYSDFVLKAKYNISLYIKEQDNFVNFINILIINNQITELINIIKFMNIIKKYEYDTFILKYNNKLKNRLISYINLSSYNFNKKIYNETKIYDLLYSIIKDKICIKIKKLINDTIYSYHINQKINNKTKTIITSYNTWIINQTEGVIDNEILYNYNSVILEDLKKYNIEYKKENENKNLLWLPHHGQIKCEYLGQIFIMLPIQYMILEAFNDEIEHTLDYIYNLNILKNYSIKIKENLINTLILSKLLLLNNNKLLLSSDSSIKYDNNLILLYLNNNEKLVLPEIEDEESLTLSRMEIINVNINSLLKIKSLSKEELFINLQNKIKLFNITKELYNKSLEYMEKNEYINIIDNNCFKIQY